MQSQDFVWGVLAMNPDKDRYLPGDKARIDIGVLNDHGNIVCTADLTLDITSPSGKTKTLSTKDQSITTTGTCGKKEAGFIEPDFTTSFTPSETGNYQLHLTAVTDNGERSTSSTLTVLDPNADGLLTGDSNAVIISRTAATRLWPFAPSPMTISVKFNRDFNGTISDTVPEGFLVTDVSDGGQVSDLQDLPNESQKGYVISWNGSWQAGQTATFTYRYDAPDISPQFYLIGPLALTPSDSSSPSQIEELRSWQIANDATKTWDGGGSTNNWSEGANWNGDTIPTSADDIVFDGTSTKNVTWDSGCPSTVNSFLMNTGYTGIGTIATTYGSTFPTFHVVGDMTINSGTLQHNTNTSAETNRLNLTVSGSLLIGTGASVNVTGLGYSGYNGPGASDNSNGASYGGMGGENLTQTPFSFGKTTHRSGIRRTWLLLRTKPRRRSHSAERYGSDDALRSHERERRQYDRSIGRRQYLPHHRYTCGTGRHSRQRRGGRQRQRFRRRRSRRGHPHCGRRGLLSVPGNHERVRRKRPLRRCRRYRVSTDRSAGGERGNAHYR